MLEPHVPSWVRDRPPKLGRDLKPMPPALIFQPIPVSTRSNDEDGRLVLADGRLVAVLVRLAGQEHGELRGGWFLEAGFGCCAVRAPDVFRTLAHAEPWIEQRLSR